MITLSQFRRYLHHLEKEIQATKARVIDSTEGGAEKRGAYPSPLSAVLEDLEEPESPRHKIATLLRAVPDRSEAVAETTELLKKARALLAEGRDGLAWFKGDALGLLDRVVPENFDELQDEMATPWLAVYESELFQLVVGSAGGRLIHRVARTTPEPFRSLREGLDWLRATYASFLEDAVTLLDEFAHRLGKALTDANSQD